MPDTDVRFVETPEMAASMRQLREHLKTYADTYAQFVALQERLDDDESAVHADRNTYNAALKELVIQTFLAEGNGVCFGEHHLAAQDELLIVAFTYHDLEEDESATIIIPVCTRCERALIKTADASDFPHSRCIRLEEPNVFDVLSENLRRGNFLDQFVRTWATSNGFPGEITENSQPGSGHAIYKQADEQIKPAE